MMPVQAEARRPPATEMTLPSRRTPLKSQPIPPAMPPRMRPKSEKPAPAMTMAPATLKSTSTSPR